MQVMFLFDIEDLLREDNTLQVKIKPNGKENEIIGVMSNGVLTIELKAPAVDYKANKALIKFISDVTNKPKSCFSIVSGFKSQYKLLKLL